MTLLLNRQVAAFAELGRLFQQVELNFADPIPVTDPAILRDRQTDLEQQAGELDRIYDVVLDPDTDTFKGKAAKRIALNRFKIFGFEISPTRIYYKPINAEEVKQFAESAAGRTAILEYAAKKGTGKRAGMKLNCKGTNYQCGGKCQSDTKGCNSVPNTKQSAAIAAAANQVKGGAIVPVSKPALAKGESKQTGKSSASNSQQDKINEKYASAKPTEEAIDGWQRDMLKYHTSSEGLALDELVSRYHTQPGGIAWGEQPEYVKEISDRKTFINATLQREKERADTRGDIIGKWESYSGFTAVERQKMEKTIANPKTGDKTRQRLQTRLDNDRATSEAAAARESAKYNKSPEDRRKELEAEFDQIEQSKTKQSQKLQAEIDKGDVDTIQRETERVLRPLEAYKDGDDDINVLDTRKRQREVVRNHLIQQSKNESPEKVLGLGSDASVEQIKRAYRDAARKAHPDAGGTAEDFQRVNEAFTRLRQKMNFVECMELSDFADVVLEELTAAG